MQRFATIRTTTTYRVEAGDLDDRTVEAIVRAVGHDGLDERVELMSDEDVDVTIYRAPKPSSEALSATMKAFMLLVRDWHLTAGDEVAPADRAAIAKLLIGASDAVHNVPQFHDGGLAAEQAMTDLSRFHAELEDGTAVPQCLYSHSAWRRFCDALARAVSEHPAYGTPLTKEG